MKSNKINKIPKNYRINPLIAEAMEELIEKINVKETAFVEIALIEKMSKLKSYSYENDKIKKMLAFIDKL